MHDCIGCSLWWCRVGFHDGVRRGGGDCSRRNENCVYWPKFFYHGLHWCLLFDGSLQWRAGSLRCLARQRPRSRRNNHDQRHHTSKYECSVRAHGSRVLPEAHSCNMHLNCPYELYATSLSLHAFFSHENFSDWLLPQ